METKKITRIFTAWQDEKEQKWLQEMASNGWLLYDVGFLRYYFKKIEPKDIRFQLDYQDVKKEDLSEYLELFTSAGWNYVGQLNGWFYFYNEEASGQEIYTDNQSLIEKYNRVLRTLIIAGWPSLYFSLFYPRMIEASGNCAFCEFYEGLRFVVFIVSLLLVYAIIRIWMKIDRLKKNM